MLDGQLDAIGARHRTYKVALRGLLELLSRCLTDIGVWYGQLRCPGKDFRLRATHPLGANSRGVEPRSWRRQRGGKGAELDSMQSAVRAVRGRRPLDLLELGIKGGFVGGGESESD